MLQEKEKKKVREKKIRELKSRGIDVGSKYEKYKVDGGSSNFNDWLELL